MKQNCDESLALKVDTLFPDFALIKVQDRTHCSIVASGNIFTHTHQKTGEQEVLELLARP